MRGARQFLTAAATRKIDKEPTAMQEFLQFLRIQYGWMAAVGRTLTDFEKTEESDLWFLDEGKHRT